MTHQRFWKTVYKTGVWLTAEIWLNLIGLDNLADYSEYLFTQDSELSQKNCSTVKIVEYPPQFCPQIDDLCPVPGAAITLADLEASGHTRKTEIFQHKCQQLATPCYKVMCLAQIPSHQFKPEVND